MNKLKKGSDVSHYQTDTIECIDSQRASLSHEEFRGHCKGNVQKYLWRYPEKHGEDDLRELYKSRDYIDFLIQHEEERIANKSTEKPGGEYYWDPDVCLPPWSSLDATNGGVVNYSFHTGKAISDDELRDLHNRMAEGDET